MLMEAMRLSQIEYEEQQRKEAEEKRKKEGQQQSSEDASGQSSGNAGPSSSNSSLPPIPISAPINIGQLQASGSTPHSSSSGRPSLSSEPRSSPLGSSVGEASSPLPIPQSSPSHGPSHSRSGSATPNLREATLRKSLEGSLPSLPNSASASQDVIATEASPSVNPAASALEAVGGDSLPTAVGSTSGSSLTPSPALQEQVQAVAAPTAPVRKETSMSVATMASELTENGPVYDELPSSPNSPSRRPLLLETPAGEIPEPGSSSVGPDGGA